MSIRFRTAAALAAGLMLLSGVALAQDMEAAATDGSLTLAQGFSPDPRVVDVDTGSAIDATSLSAACVGYLSTAPNVRVDYSGTGASLIISADSSSDTSLFVVAPNGAWYCDDDGGQEGANPALAFARPEAGIYLIWVGGPQNGAEAQLQLSASSSQ